MAPGIRNWLLLAAVALCCAEAGAQSPSTETRLRDQLREATLQLRQAQDENASLRARQQQLEASVAAASKPAVDHSGALRGQLKERDAVIAGLQEQLTEAQEQLVRAGQKASTQLKQQVDDSEKLRAQAQQLQTALQAGQESTRSCELKNAQLVIIAGELLQHYQNKGVWTAVSNAEPLTQIERVQLETLAQDYHIKIKERTLAPPAPPAPPAPKP